MIARLPTTVLHSGRLYTFASGADIGVISREESAHYSSVRGCVVNGEDGKCLHRPPFRIIVTEYTKLHYLHAMNIEGEHLGRSSVTLRHTSECRSLHQVDNGWAESGARVLPLLFRMLIVVQYMCL